jgi:hypothetical protein
VAAPEPRSEQFVIGLINISRQRALITAPIVVRETEKVKKRLLYLKRISARRGYIRKGAVVIMTKEETLAHIDLFSTLTKKELQTLAMSAQERSFSAGTTIIVQGDAGVGLYICVDILSYMVEMGVCPGRVLSINWLCC